MTISSTTNRVAYTGNGVTTSFSFPYYVIAAADLKVYKAGVLQTITTHYTLSGTAPYTSGTDVQFVSAPTSGQSIVIVRDPDITQSVDLVENDPLPVETAVERPLDKITMIAQRLKDLLDRAIKLADTDTSGASVTLPTPEANRLIGWNSDGDELENVDPDDIATIVGSQSWVVDKFNGTGAQTAFTLSENPGSVNALIVDISGVKQTHTADYTLSGTTLTFTAAPAAGTNNVRVQYGQVQTTTTTPADGTVTTAKIVDLNVTTDKINDLAVTTGKIANDAVTYAKIQNVSATSRLLGRASSGAGDVEEISLNGGLSISSTTLIASLIGSFRNLVVKSLTDSTLSVTADEAVLLNSSNVPKVFRTVSESADITASGANGLDTGAEANSTWYYVWLIGKEDGTIDSLLSTSSTSPTMPSGYTYKLLVGSVRNDGSGNFIAFHQLGNKVSISEQNVFNNQSGVGGSWTNQSISSIVPPIAIAWWGTAGVSANASRGILIAADSNGVIGKQTCLNYAGGTQAGNYYGSAPVSEMPILNGAQNFYWSTDTAAGNNYRVDVSAYRIAI